MTRRRSFKVTLRRRQPCCCDVCLSRRHSCNVSCVRCYHVDYYYIILQMRVKRFLVFRHCFFFYLPPYCALTLLRHFTVKRLATHWRTVSHLFLAYFNLYEDSRRRLLLRFLCFLALCWSNKLGRLRAVSLLAIRGILNRNFAPLQRHQLQRAAWSRDIVFCFSSTNTKKNLYVFANRLLDFQS